MTPAALEPRRHDPPTGWSSETFEHLTDALAAALVAAYRRAVEEQTASGGRPRPKAAGR
jgi:hypothetical protein